MFERKDVFLFLFCFVVLLCFLVFVFVFLFLFFFFFFFLFFSDLNGVHGSIKMDVGSRTNDRLWLGDTPVAHKQYIARKKSE